MPAFPNSDFFTGRRLSAPSSSRAGRGDRRYRSSQLTIQESKNSMQAPFTNSQFFNPTPYHLRTLVLDYLCHNCYTATARAFARDTAVRHLDADGDEIIQPGKGLDGPDDLKEDVLRLVQLREQIRTHILSGRVDDATALLNEHFPSVLSITSDPNTEPRVDIPSDRLQYIAPTSVDPAHLSLNLRILAFIEASRTIPLHYTPLGSTAVSPGEPPHVSETVYEHDDPNVLDKQQTELLARAQKLYAAASMLQKPSDRVTYLKELGNVGGLLAYKVPEESTMSKYLSQERREAVADQINSAILYRTGLPAVSYMELYTRYTTTLWSLMHDLHVKSPPLANQPPGVHLPRTGNAGTKGEEVLDPVPLFDLQQFLDSRT